MFVKFIMEFEKFDSFLLVEYIIELDFLDYFNYGRKLLFKMIEWKMLYFLEFGIQYDKFGIDFEILMFSVKQIFWKFKQLEIVLEILKMYKCLIELMKDWWIFLFDFESVEKLLIGEGVVKMLIMVEKVIKVFEQENYNIMENLNKINLGDWRRYLVNKLFCFIFLNFY